MEKITPNREELKRRRNNRQLSQDEVAKLINKSSSYISRLESGSSRVMSLEVAVDLAYVLKCSPCDISDGANTAKLRNMKTYGISTGQHAELRNWMINAKDVRPVLILAIRCGWKGLESFDIWLQTKAADADREDVYTVASQCGFKRTDKEEMNVV